MSYYCQSMKESLLVFIFLLIFTSPSMFKPIPSFPSPGFLFFFLFTKYNAIFISFTVFFNKYMVKSLPAMQETQVSSLDLEDFLEKEMATHSSILAWRIPWTECLVSPRLWGQKESDMTEQLTATNAVFISFTIFFINTFCVKGLPWWLRW